MLADAQSLSAALSPLLIANRGEIAIRVIRAARDLGIKTIAVYSDADGESLHVKMADAAINIGAYRAAMSYLNSEAILKAAEQSHARAIHPGYGFLSENADFADAVRAAGLIFIGPQGQVIRAMGDKANAREAAIKAGVPVVPGTQGIVEDLARALAEAERIGFPLMIKAAAGGGGRGIRLCANESDLQKFWPTAKTEAKSAFGNAGLYLERFIAQARHIEVQVLGDGHRAVHLFERECSLQRRRQKVWEEAPAPNLDEHTRQAMCQCAVRLTESVRYSGAGTIEFLLDQESGQFFFMEMNTRIQVEHPVTEAITGVDLVREMFHIAQGRPLRLEQSAIERRGAAIEVRINAEDPARNFLPQVGPIERLFIPGGPGVRFDSMLYPGYRIAPYYDSLLAKLIVHDESRPMALSRLAGALDELEIGPIATTASLHSALLRDARVMLGEVHTGFLESWLADGPLGLASL